MYIGSMRDNVKRSLNYNWSQGIWQGYAPLGYINTKGSNGRATIDFDPERAEIVKTLFEEYANTNHSIISLTKYAKELGLISRETIKKRKTNHITKTGIYHILQNPFYYGIMRVKGQLMPHIHPKLIDKTLFDKVQEKLTDKKTLYGRNTNGALSFAFRGLIHCSTCNCTITPEQHTKKSGKQYTYLRCSHIKGNCKQGIVNENILFEQLNNEIFKNIKITPIILDSLKANARKHLENEATINSNMKKTISNQLNSIKAKEERLFDFLLDGNVDKSTYEIKKTELEEEKTKLQDDFEKHTEITDDMKKTIDDILDIIAKAPIYMKTANPSQKRELLNLLFANCALQGKRIIYNLQTPFDKLVQNPKSLDWLENIKDFDKLSNQIENFRENIALL